MSRMDEALDEIYGSISHLYNYEEPDFEDMQLRQQKYRELMATAKEMLADGRLEKIANDMGFEMKVVKKLPEYSDGGHGRTCECYPCQQLNYRMDRDDPSVGGDEG